MTYLDHLAEKYQGDFPIEWKLKIRLVKWLMNHDHEIVSIVMIVSAGIAMYLLGRYG